MANYVFGASTFKPATGTPTQAVLGGEAIAVGDAVFRDATLGKYFLCDANDATTPSGGSTARNAGMDGVCMAACAGDGCSMVISGGAGSVIDTGATTTQVMAAGDTLVVSTTAGKLQPAPATSGSKLIIAAVATTATQIKLVQSVGGTAP